MRTGDTIRQRTEFSRLRALLLASTVLVIGVSTAHGQNATWLSAPATGDWNTAGNWTPATVPTGTATFGASNTTPLTFSQSITSVGTLQFNAGAPAYSFTFGNLQTLLITGTGIVNNSSNVPTFTSNGFNASRPSDQVNASLVFQNSSTAANASIVNNATGSASFEGSSSAGNAAIADNANSITFFSGTSTAANATITNTGTSLALSGVTDFYNTSTAGNSTITNNFGGILEMFDHSTDGAATIITNNGGVTQFFDNSTGGQARFITAPGGIVDFSETTGPANDHKLTAGSIEAAGSYFLGANEVTVGGNNLSTTVSGVISNCGPTGTECVSPASGGSLVKVGSGTLTLSGTNTYTGATTVNAGTLLVNGSIVSSSLTSVNNGGILGGTGTVGTTHINSGGTFAPGTPGVPGTSMTVTGNLAFQSGATYLVRVNPTTATIANVSDTASLSGGIVSAGFAEGSYVQKQYDILHTAGLGGTTFASLGTTSLPSGFNASLSYTATDVMLNLSANLGGGGIGTGGLNQNQLNVANALNNFFNGGGTLTPNFLPLFRLIGGNLAAALSRSDGEIPTGADRVAYQMMTQFFGVMLDPFVDGRSGTGWPAGGGGMAHHFAPEQAADFPPDIALAYASVLKAPPKPIYDQRWNAWGTGFGGTSRTSGDPAIGSNNLRASDYGFAGGMDYHFSPDAVAGFALAGGGTNWDLAQGLGSGRSDAFQAGVYGAARAGAAYVSGALAFANHAMKTNRIAFAGDQLNASFNAQSYGARIEAGYRYTALPTIGVTPYAALQAQSFHTPSYSETDLTGGGFALSYNAQSASDTRSELGSRFDDMTMLNGMPLSLRARVAWAHDWVTNPSLSAVFQALPGAGFIVNGATIPRNSALASAGAELHIAADWSLAAKFEGEFASGSQTYAGTGTLRHTW
jgi:outer membrane autotransporter protein